MKQILGYDFNDPALLEEALTHPSLCSKKNDKPAFNYERLEFLGDSVLGLVIAEMLIVQFPLEEEGKLAKRKSGLVAGDILAKIATAHEIGNKILMTDSEEKSGGRENPHNLENVLEAILGAVYLDSGIDPVKKIIKRIWQPLLEEMQDVPIDSKSKLQEILQKKGKKLPIYKLVSTTGPGHMLSFTVRLEVSGFESVEGEGKSKQEAEKKAATKLLEQIND